MRTSKEEPLKQQGRSRPELWADGFHASPAKSRLIPGYQQRAQNLEPGWSALGRWVALLQSRFSPFIPSLLPYLSLFSHGPVILSFEKIPTLHPHLQKTRTKPLLLEL